MIGSVSPAMHKYIWVPAWWVVKHKFLKGGKYALSENAFIPEAQSKGTPMTKIAVILCYFGKLPENFPLFAEAVGAMLP